MLHTVRATALEFIESRLGPDVMARLDALEEELGGRETDDFGFTPDQLKWVLPVAAFFYRFWFRADVEGLENLPAGRALLVANHSGQLPIRAHV